MIVIGIDPSLTSTGIAVIDTDDVLNITVTRERSTGHLDAPWDARHARIEDMAARVVSGAYFDRGIADLAVLEAPSLGQKHAGAAHDRAGLWWAVYTRLRDFRVPVLPVPPTCRAKYATGKGNATKDAVLLAVSRRYPQAPVSGNDEADAVVLAAMGARMLGVPVEDSLPKAHVEALVRLALPVGVAA